MQLDYIASRDAVNGSGTSFRQESSDLSLSEAYGSSFPPSYTPPISFDDPELVHYALRDGPRLPPATRMLYVTFAKLTNPETGYSTPSHEQLANEAVMSISSVKEHLGYLEEFGKIRKTNRSTPDEGTLPNAYYFVGLDTGLIPREMNPPCSNPITAARQIFQQEKLDALDRKHNSEKAAILAEKEVEQQYSALLQDKLKAAGIDIPDRPESPKMQASGTEKEGLVDDEVRLTPSQILTTPPQPSISERRRRVAEKVKNEWSWMHSSFTWSGININGAIRHFARSEENEEDLDFQISNYYAGEEAKKRPRPRYQHDDRQEIAEPSVPVWDGPPAEPEARQLWLAVLENLQARLPRPTFETWLRPTIGMTIEAGEKETMVVVAPTPFAVQWLERRMFKGLSTELEKAAGRPMELQLRARILGGEEEFTQQKPETREGTG